VETLLKPKRVVFWVTGGAHGAAAVPRHTHGWPVCMGKKPASLYHCGGKLNV
jgi:hypothetical protein